MDLSSASFEDLVREMIRRVGEDPAREGLVKTPERVAMAMKWMTRGYATDPCDIIRTAMFQERHESMILVRDIDFYSLCEHHMLPFFGKAHVAYVDVYARRLQVQERLTDQIADAFQRSLEPAGVGVVIEAYHLCMMMRGVEKQHSKAVTSAVRGVFRDDQKTRDEFLRLVHGGFSLE